MILHRKEQKNASIVEKTIFHKDSFYRKIMVIFLSFMLLISSGSVHKVNAEPLTGATVATIVLTVGVIGGVGSVGFYLFEQWTDGKAPTIEGLISNFTWGVALASASALALLLAPIASSPALATVLSVSGPTLATVEGRTSAISAYLAEKTEPVVELAVNRYVTKHSLGYISIDDLNNVIAHLDGKIRNGLFRELEECVDETAPPEDVGNFDFSGLYVRDMSFANGQSVHPDDQLNLTLIFEDHNGMGVGNAIATVVLQPKVAEDYDPATLLVSSALKPLTPTGKYSLDIKLPADLPVGSYNLYISFKDPATGLILSNAESAGQSSPYAISINVENDCPVAVISSNASSVNVGSSVTLDAADSYDPNGDSITYQWTLQAQDKSMSNLTSTTGLSTDFTPDLPGSYTIVLRVSDGKSNAESKIIIKAEKTYDLSPIQLEREKISGPISGEAYSERYYPIEITASQNVARLDISLHGYSKANRDADIYVSYNKKPSVKFVEYNNGNTIPEIDADYEDSDHNQKDEWIEIPNPKPGTYWVLLYGYMSAYSGIDLYYQINTGVKDSDGDGVPDDQDAFPNDKNEAYDSDGDGVGDNADAFPNDPAASIDSDGDGYPDAWNPGKSEADSTTGLRLDSSPNDPKRWDNVKPVIEPLSDQVVNIGEKKVIVLSITDADGDDLTVTLLNTPGFVELSEQTLLVSPESGDEGVYTVIVQVQDDFGGSAWNTFVVNVVNSSPPNIDPLSKTEISQLYVATFNRAPDAGGLNFWVNSGLTLEEIAEEFFKAPETQRKYPPGTTDAAFVNTIYQNVFGRDAETEGLNYWVNVLGNGWSTRDEMIMTVIEGARNKDLQVLLNKTEVGLYYMSEVGENHVEGNPFSLADITDNEATIADAKNDIDLLNVVPSAIELSRTVVALEIGESTNISINGGAGNFSVVNSNTQIASAWISGNNLGITGLSEGTITLVVTDAEGKSADVTVTVAPLIPHSVTCGAYVAPGVWKEFDCYNLAAFGKTTGDDPFTPTWRLIGGYWQWGRKGPDPSQWYDTNTSHFVHGPTGPGDNEANSGEISGWDTSYVPDGAWSDASKTANDPCPVGFRVPSLSQWEGVWSNNSQSEVGTWIPTNIEHTNYSSALFFGEDLMLPAAGSHGWGLSLRGFVGFYQSSTQSSATKAWYLIFSSSGAGRNDINDIRRALSVRCVAE